MKFFVFKLGTIFEIKGIKEVNKINNVKHLKLFVKPGDKLEKPQSGVDRHGFVILKANSADKIDSLYQKVMNTIEIVYKND